MIVVFLSTAIPTVLTQRCDQMPTCIDGQPLINCSRVFKNVTQITVYILENLPANSVVYCLDDELFFPNADYELSTSDFDINSTIGAIVVKEHLDYEQVQEQQRMVTITARATQNGTEVTSEATLIVNIVNVNEFAPVLSGSNTRSFNFIEGSTPTSYELFISDDDAEPQSITYIINGTGSEHFDINVDNRIENFPVVEMIFRPGLVLDRENISMYQLTITAIDNIEPVKYSNPLDINITVDDINDNAPQFTNNRTFTIPTVLGAGKFVGNASASDPDAGENGTVIYNIISSTDLFRIDNAGILYTTMAYTENRNMLEDMGNTSIEIMAKDNGSIPMNSTATFVIILQHPPQFSNDTYVFSLEENNNVDVTVGTVMASFIDDNSMSLFYEVGLDAKGRFKIDNDTGVIKALVSLDRENSSVETFTVMAMGVMDARLVSTANVSVEVLDQNDQRPQFDSEMYNFMITAREPVAGRISATDNDIGVNAVVTFSISTSVDIPLNITNVGNNQADIIVIDHSQTGEFRFSVLATDAGGLQDTARVIVEINPDTETDDMNSSRIIVIVAIPVSIVVLLLLSLIVSCVCYHMYRKRYGQYSVHSKDNSSFNGFTNTDSGNVPTRKKSILKVPTGENGKFGSPSCSEAASERVKFEPRANMVMFELDQPTIRKEASITTDTKLGSGDDSSICSGHNKHIDRDEGLILRSSFKGNVPLAITTLSSTMTDSDDEDDFPSIPSNQLFTGANNLRTQPPQPTPIGATNHAYSPPLHHYNPVPPAMVEGGQMLSSENLDRHNRAMAKRHKKVPSDQYSETSDGTGTYFTSDAEDGSAYGEPPATWTSL